MTFQTEVICCYHMSSFFRSNVSQPFSAPILSTPSAYWYRHERLGFQSATNELGILALPGHTGRAYNFTTRTESTLCLKKSSQLLTVCNFVKSYRIFKIITWLESVRNLLQNLYDTTHLTLGMLLHYLGKLKIEIFCKCGRKRKQSAFFHRL